MTTNSPAELHGFHRAWRMVAGAVVLPIALVVGWLGTEFSGDPGGEDLARPLAWALEPFVPGTKGDRPNGRDAPMKARPARSADELEISRRPRPSRTSW